MLKFKLLAGVAASLAILALSAAPAGAWFASLNGKSQGPAKIVSTTTLTVGANAKVSCETAEGEWHLQTKGQFKLHEKGGNQEPTTKGPHLYIKISKWNKCKATVLGVSVSGVTVSPCEFQLEQPTKGVNKSTATVITACVITVPLKPTPCTITVFAANESTGLNDFLEKVVGENSGKNVVAEAKVEGIHGEASCLSGGFTTGKFESLAEGLVAEELNLE